MKVAVYFQLAAINFGGPTTTTTPDKRKWPSFFLCENTDRRQLVRFQLRGPTPVAKVSPEQGSCDVTLKSPIVVVVVVVGQKKD